MGRTSVPRWQLVLGLAMAVAGSAAAMILAVDRTVAKPTYAGGTDIGCYFAADEPCVRSGNVDIARTQSWATLTVEVSNHNSGDCGAFKATVYEGHVEGDETGRENPKIRGKKIGVTDFVEPQTEEDAAANGGRTRFVLGRIPPGVSELAVVTTGRPTASCVGLPELDRWGGSVYAYLGPPETWIEGRVSSTTGKPLRRVQVIVRSGRTRRSVQTGKTGTYAVKLPQRTDSYTVRALKGGLTLKPAIAKRLIRKGTTARVNFKQAAR